MSIGVENQETCGFVICDKFNFFKLNKKKIWLILFLKTYCL